MNFEKRVKCAQQNIVHKLIWISTKKYFQSVKPCKQETRIFQIISNVRTSWLTVF